MEFVENIKRHITFQKELRNYCIAIKKLEDAFDVVNSLILNSEGLAETAEEKKLVLSMKSQSDLFLRRKAQPKEAGDSRDFEAAKMYSYIVSDVLNNMFNLVSDYMMSNEINNSQNTEESATCSASF